ncbi:transcriptional regulator, AraC family [Gloeocapsa sp. PCC 7428]|uniref:helix-turn-helix transcriptional regulator n=1 Tax=Gloeocapsa sp. PCC 7428 TaxID=1173026 RepID=UPI0002A61A9A|nr:AraC family transcriptional regulator [Gloeocapsa sp. PCC 7428]AFZ28891.1 transcriptional regulator, AraC family [Gloeocapsa sp. PCC 7428]
MKMLTAAEYDYLWEAGLKQDENFSDIKGFDEMGRCLTYWTDNRYRGVELQQGLSLYLSDAVFNQDIASKHEHDASEMLTSKFYLSGLHRVVSPPGIEGVETDYVEQGGQNYLFYLPNIEEVEQGFAGDRLQRVRIEVDLNFLRVFVTQLDFIPKILHPLVDRGAAPRFHHTVGSITPAMGIVIQQMWHTPYQGMIGRIFLEAKTLELLALQLSQLIESQNHQPSINLHPADIDRIHQARHILQQNAANPPSVMGLAQQVGLEHMKLKRGFRQIFGTTPFGYLRDYRMEQARLLLLDGKLSVAAVANAIGYSHVGHFSSAFQQKFGITPGECRRQKTPFYRPKSEAM